MQRPGIKTPETQHHKGLQALYVMHEKCMIKSERVGGGPLRAGKSYVIFCLFLQVYILKACSYKSLPAKTTI